METEVIIVGGGMAGVCAALAAARHGAKTVLVQDRPVLGGNSSSEIRMHIRGADYDDAHRHSRESGILEELRLEEAVRNPQRNPCMWDLILWEKVTQEPNIELLLNTTCTGVQMASDSRIAAITASRESTEDRFIIKGDIFIDCSGDGRVGYEAGADFRMGREGPDEHNEPHAQGPDNKTMGNSIMWIARDMGVPVPFTAPPWARKFLTDDDLPHRDHSELCTGHWWIEYGGELDIIKDAEEIRDELLACMLGVWDHVKNHGNHGAANWAITWWSFVPGKRESRRFLGDHILTENDLLDAVLFEDRVAHGGWPIDEHIPGGIFSPQPVLFFIRLKDIYSIPLRSLYSRNIENLFVAGRNASCIHMAFASTRVMGTVAVMGQAAGTAAVMCINKGCLPCEIVRKHIKELQQGLLKDDQYIPDLPADDPADLAPQATITASSELPDTPAANVVTGVTRYRKEQTNQWASDPEEPSPQSLELSWAEPVNISQIHLTFDTGFHRQLVLSHRDRANSSVIRGPQPETIRDYDVQLRAGDNWYTIIRERGNYQRKVRHQITPQPAGALRLVVYSTNGDASARLHEIRAY